MTQSQRLRRIGFNARLVQSGVAFALPSGTEVVALVDISPPDALARPLSPTEREGTYVYFNREHLNGQTLTVEQTLTKDGMTYRITDVDDHPDNIWVRVRTELGKGV